MGSRRQPDDERQDVVCLRVLERCLEARPECVDLRARLALCHVALGNPQVAETILRSSVELDPGHVSTRLHLGWLLELRGRRGEAAAEYRAVLAQDPGHAEARGRVVSLARGPVVTTPRGGGAGWWAEQAARRLGPR